MPGIAGIISKSTEGKNENDLSLMIDCMMHEPFYTKGSYVNHQLGVYVGWVCHRGSFSDCMPVVNEQEDIMLIFSGENFADKSMTEQLKRYGHEFNRFNASYLIHLYEEEGDSFLRRLNGWFCGILVDLRKAMVVLFNDRYGMHRVYYHEGKDAFLFASEAKALLKVRQELRNVDIESLGEFVSCGCVLQNRTLFLNVSLLPGGAAWRWHNKDSIKKKFYFKPSDWENQSLLDKETFYSQLKETILKILPRYFRAEEKIGMSLTGGLDSRLLMAVVNPAPGALPCYTFGGMRDMLDIRIARKVAEVCQQTHNVIRLHPRFFSEFSRFAEKTIYITDGGLDISNTHDIYFNALAREIASIRVTGKFGSEVIRDHTMFNETRLCEQLFHPNFRMYVQKAVETLNEMKKGCKLSVAIFKEFPWRESSKLALEQSQLIFRTPYLDNELVESMYHAPSSVRTSNEFQRRMIKDYNSTLSNIMTDRGFVSDTNSLFSRFLELYYYSLFKIDYIYLFELPNFLTKLDSICMSINGGRQILGFQKFEYYRLWFRRELSKYVQEVILDERTIKRPYFDKQFLQVMVRKHLQGSRNYLNEINKVMTIELMHRLLIDV